MNTSSADSSDNDTIKDLDLLIQRGFASIVRNWSCVLPHIPSLPPSLSLFLPPSPPPLSPYQPTCISAAEQLLYLTLQSRHLRRSKSLILCCCFTAERYVDMLIKEGVYSNIVNLITHPHCTSLPEVKVIAEQLESFVTEFRKHNTIPL